MINLRESPKKEDDKLLNKKLKRPFPDEELFFESQFQLSFKEATVIQSFKKLEKVDLIREVFSFMNLQEIQKLSYSLRNKRINPILRKIYFQRISNFQFLFVTYQYFNENLFSKIKISPNKTRLVEYIPVTDEIVFHFSNSKSIAIKNNSGPLSLEGSNYIKFIKQLPRYNNGYYIACFYDDFIKIMNIKTHIFNEKELKGNYSDLLFYDQLKFFAAIDDFLNLYKIGKNYKDCKRKALKIIKEDKFIKKLNLNITDIQQFYNRFVLVHVNLTQEGKTEVNNNGQSQISKELLELSSTLFIVDLVKLKVAFTIPNISENNSSVTNIFYSESYSKDKDIVIILFENLEVKVWKLSTRSCIKTIKLPFSIKSVFMLDNFQSAFLYVLSTENCQGILMLKEKPEEAFKLLKTKNGDFDLTIPDERILYVGSENMFGENCLKICSICEDYSIMHGYLYEINYEQL